jgi:hypothetical protein
MALTALLLAISALLLSAAGVWRCERAIATHRAETEESSVPELLHRVVQAELAIARLNDVLTENARRTVTIAAREAKRSQRRTQAELEAEAQATLTTGSPAGTGAAAVAQPAVGRPQSRAELLTELRRKANLAGRPH